MRKVGGAAVARPRGAALGAVLACLALFLTSCGDTPTTEPAPTPGSTGTTATATRGPIATDSPTAAPTGPTTTPSRRPSTPTTTPKPTTAPTSGVPSRLAGTDWERIPTTRKVVALTFDAGSDRAAVQSVLATLRREGVRATFFMTGAWADRYPGTAAEIAARHRIGNHSQTHPHFTQLSDARIRSELSQAAQRIRQASGHDPAPLFRFPFGDRDAHRIRVVNDSGYVPVRWTVDTLGWKGTSGGMTADRVVQRVMAGLRPGEIVLMHVGSNPDDHSTLDADALPAMIGRLRGAGYTFVTLDALIG